MCHASYLTSVCSVCTPDPDYLPDACPTPSTLRYCTLSVPQSGAMLRDLVDLLLGWSLEPGLQAKDRCGGAVVAEVWCVSGVSPCGGWFTALDLLL